MKSLFFTVSSSTGRLDVGDFLDRFKVKIHELHQNSQKIEEGAKIDDLDDDTKNPSNNGESPFGEDKLFCWIILYLIGQLCIH